MGEGTRTLDSWDHNPVLYQLSYTHRMRQKGFEPLTHGLEGRCSNPTELLARLTICWRFGALSPAIPSNRGEPI